MTGSKHFLDAFSDLPDRHNAEIEALRRLLGEPVENGWAGLFDNQFGNGAGIE